MRRAAKAVKMASDIVREGVFAINKPCGQSSAQIIRDCQVQFNPSNFFKPLIEAEKAKRFQESPSQFKRRKLLKKASQVKIGHGGTLDPLATGVLILGIGSGTKALPQFLDCTKTYETVVLFGASTDTYDRVGRTLTHRPYEHITRELVEKQLANFRGKRIQMPPLYSALKMNGKPLYEYAREGKPIPREIEGREVEALEVELLEWYPPKTHTHRWPTEQAEAAERNLAEQVWSIKKQQETAKKLTPEEKELDDQAIAAHETFKRKFEERQDELIRDSPAKRQRHQREQSLLMSGALGQLPEPTHSNRGVNLVPELPAENTPPPWTDEGPPAAKIRLTVTSGYYVRSFCHDLGAKLGSAAIMAELCRTRQSDFTVGGPNCLEYDDLAKGEDVWGPKVADMLARWNGEPDGQFTTQAASQPQQSSKPSESHPNADSKSVTPNNNTVPRETRNTNPAVPRLKLSEKRPRSSSPTGILSPPHKARMQTSASSLANHESAADTNNVNNHLAPSSGDQAGHQSDGEKSWNGIED